MTETVYNIDSIRPKSILKSQLKWPIRLLLVFGILALLAPFLANDQPLYVKYKGHHLFPALSFKKGYTLYDKTGVVLERLQYDVTEWKKLKTDLIIFPVIPYSPGKSDFSNADYISPFGKQFFESADGTLISMPMNFRHWLGTGKRGDDVLAGLIHGTRISFSVGLLSMIIAFGIGIFFGTIAGYYGDYSLKINRGGLIGIMVGIVPSWFYAFNVRAFVLQDAFAQNVLPGLFQLFFSCLIFIVIYASIIFIFGRLKFIPWFNKYVYFPFDTIISKITEIFISLPRLLLIITFSAITGPSFWNIVLIIGLLAWTDISRLIRAEFLKIRELDFITAARSLGYRDLRIVFYHALPNSIAPVAAFVAFGAASAILAEAGLSFLGIGIPQDIVTWGSMLTDGKENVNAWWLVLFPGLAIFLLVYTYNLLGESLRKYFLK